MNYQHRLRRVLGVLLVFTFPFASSSQAQSGNWQRVQSLKPGTVITVKAQKRYYCSFEWASQDELSCVGIRPHLRRQPSRISIPRGDVREIRVEPNQTKHGAVGALVGAGVGAAAGAGAGRGPRGGRVIGGTLGGALIGGLVGLVVPIFRRGTVIYKQ